MDIVGKQTIYLFIYFFADASSVNIFVIWQILKIIVPSVVHECSVAVN